MTDLASFDEPRRAPLLLHSLADLRELIFPCLEGAEARTVVEVGGEDGAFTRELISWAETRQATVYCVEPEPTSSLVEICDSSTVARLVMGRSPEALQEIEACDAYLLDGDHNYITTLGELQAIDRHATASGRFPLVLLHDVGWPCGRRDMYYAPETLPPEAVRPYTYEKGVAPTSSEVVDGGFRGEGRHAFAVQEGGAENGVLTAVEDFLSRRQDLVLAKVPCIFGLGVLYRRTDDNASALAELLDPYDENPILNRLEANRLALYLKVLDLQDSANDLRGNLEECQNALNDVSTENRALWARVEQLESQAEVLRATLRPLLASRPFALAERLSSIRRLQGEEPTVSRQRLRAALDSTDEPL